MLNSYWLVGATFDDENDVLSGFLKRGYWYCWDVGGLGKVKSGPGNSVSSQRDRFKRIEPGDRIAVKKLLGRGSTEMEIRALGIVKDVDHNEWRIYVDWVVEDLSRRVPLNGCTASVHGPFKLNNPWVHQIFSI